MQKCLFPLLFLAFAGSYSFSDDAKSPSRQKIDDTVSQGIRQFHDNLRSPDAKVREKEFDAAMPDQKLMEKLFAKDAAVLWPFYLEMLKEMRSSTDKLKAEFDSKGNILEIQLVDLRQSDTSGRYRRVLEIIPNDIPVYRAITKHVNGTSGSSAYLVVDGTMRMVRELDAVPDLINHLKKKDK